MAPTTLVLTPLFTEVPAESTFPSSSTWPAPSASPELWPGAMLGSDLLLITPRSPDVLTLVAA